MKSKRTIPTLISLTIIFAVSVLPALGVSTSIWTNQTQKDFKSGKPKDVSISSKGEVSLPL